MLSWLLFTFALLTDIHLSRTDTVPQFDLRQSVDDINASDSVAFVVVAGDIADAGDEGSLVAAHRELERLRVPFYATNGNHETTWSESAMQAFDRVFGSTRFAFTYDSLLFIGFNSGPLLKMADGHVSPQDLLWADSVLAAYSARHPEGKVFVITHYPLRQGDVDNWYEVTECLQRYPVQCVIGGHYHKNMHLVCDGIDDVLCRSNLRGKQPFNGYTLIRVDTDSIRFSEKRPHQAANQWTAVPVSDRPHPQVSSRPAITNDTHVQAVWRRSLPAAVYTSPVMAGGRVFVGDDTGVFHALDARDGHTIWTYRTRGRIISTAAVHKHQVVFGSADSTIYCLDTRTGQPLWTYTTTAPVMGSVAIHRGIAYIGGSGHIFYALNMHTGQPVWQFAGLGGYCISRPTVAYNTVYFGAWDCYFYALDARTGQLRWKWTNGKRNDKFSPAAVWPVVVNKRVFIAAPDRYMTCLDARTGKQIWRTNRYKVRETAAADERGTMVFSKCMWDTVVAFSAKADKPDTLWAVNAGFGYEHAPCMPLERGGTVFVGTKNGLILGLDAHTGTTKWQYRIGTSLIQTTCPINKNECLVTSTDGTIIRLRYCP